MVWYVPDTVKRTLHYKLKREDNPHRSHDFGEVIRGPESSPYSPHLVEGGALDVDHREGRHIHRSVGHRPDVVGEGIQVLTCMYMT